MQKQIEEIAFVLLRNTQRILKLEKEEKKSIFMESCLKWYKDLQKLYCERLKSLVENEGKNDR